MSERFRLRHIGWLFEEDEGETEETGVSVEASILVDQSSRAGARSGLGAGLGDGGYVW